MPVLLYHGDRTHTTDFANAADAQYGIDADDFAKQMTMIKHAGYQTISLQTFVDFVRGRRVELPPRPLLLTFDDGRADSWTGLGQHLEASFTSRPSCSSTWVASRPAIRNT